MSTPTKTPPLEIVPWTALDDLDPVIHLSGAPEAALRAEMSQFPQGIRGVVVIRGGTPVASAIQVDRLLPTTGVRTLARTFLAPGEDLDSLRRFLEADAAAAGAQVLRISLARAPGLGTLLASRGYEAVESYVQLRLAGSARAAGPLPAGIREGLLADVTTGAYLAMANEAFVDVPGAVALTPDEWKLATEHPRYDEQLVRIVLDSEGPVGFLRGMLPHAGSPAEVEVIGLLPRGRGRGLGRWLLRRCEELLRERGAEVIELLVASTNRNAYSLYLAEGYVEQWRRETWSRRLESIAR